jgi:hypothetical protein
MSRLLPFLSFAAVAVTTIIVGQASSLMAAESNTKAKRIVVMAGKPSHPPRMHEFNAGVQLLAKCLSDAPDVQVDVLLNGWPKDEGIFDGADAIIFYMDGGGRHEVVQEHGRRLKIVDGWIKDGVGVGFMHYGVEVIAGQAGAEFKNWIGGHYDNMYSCNPIWEPKFAELPKHPITRGVLPFEIKDEWYFNMRFSDGLAGNKPQETDRLKFWPILIAKPSDGVRDGPYVYPKGPYPHIQDAKGKPEAMMWAVEHPNGARGFGFTGGHFHDNWGDANFRKVVLNAFGWVAHADIPKNGYDSSVTEADLNANLDPKPPRKKK